MKFKIQWKTVKGYSHTLNRFKCPLCDHNIPWNLSWVYVQTVAKVHLNDHHEVDDDRIKFYFEEKGYRKPKVLPKTVVMVTDNDSHGNPRTSVVNPHSGENPTHFARWAAKRFTDSKYVIHTYIPVKTEEIK